MHEAGRWFRRLWLTAVLLIGHAAGLALHEIDVESLDADALLGQALAKSGQIVDDGGAGGISFGLHVSGEIAILNADV